MIKSPSHTDEIPKGFANLDVYRAYCAALMDVLFAAAMEADPGWARGEERQSFARTATKSARAPEPLQRWFERIRPDRAEALGEIVRLTIHQRHGLVAPPLS